MVNYIDRQGNHGLYEYPELANVKAEYLLPAFRKPVLWPFRCGHAFLIVECGSLVQVSGLPTTAFAVCPFPAVHNTLAGTHPVTYTVMIYYLLFPTPLPRCCQCMFGRYLGGPIRIS